MLGSNPLLVPLDYVIFILAVGIALVKLLFIFLQRRYNFEPSNTLSISGIFIVALFFGAYGILVFFRPSLFEYKPTEWEVKWEMNKVVNRQTDKLDEIKDRRAQSIRRIELALAWEALFENDEVVKSREPSREESRVMTLVSSHILGDQEVSEVYKKFLQLKYPSWHKRNQENESGTEKQQTTFDN